MKIETVPEETWLATYTLFPSAEMQIAAGELLKPLAIVVVPESAPVLVFLSNVETVLPVLLAA